MQRRWVLTAWLSASLAMAPVVVRAQSLLPRPGVLFRRMAAPAPPPPRVEIRWAEPHRHNDSSAARRAQMIRGLGGALLAGSYLPGVFWGSVGVGERSPTAWLLVPVVGPFIAVAVTPLHPCQPPALPPVGNVSAALAFPYQAAGMMVQCFATDVARSVGIAGLLVDGLAQVGGALMLLSGSDWMHIGADPDAAAHRLRWNMRLSAPGTTGGISLVLTY